MTNPASGGPRGEGEARELYRHLLEARGITGDVVALSGVAGMVPPGKDDINPEVNAVQTLVAARNGGAWKVALFQNTPAAFHGRPDDAKALTEELRAAHRQSSPNQPISGTP